MLRNQNDRPDERFPRTRVLTSKAKTIARLSGALMVGATLLLTGCTAVEDECDGLRGCGEEPVPQPADGRVIPPIPSEQPDIAVPLQASDEAPAKPIPDAKPPAGKRVVGYYPNYKMYNGYEPEQIPYEQLTDINYSFAYIANGSNYYTSSKYYPQGLPETGTCAPSDWWADKQKPLTVGGKSYTGGFAAVNQGGKAKNPNLKTFLSIGGYQQIVGLDGETRTIGDVPWSLVTKDDAAMDKFVQGCVSLINDSGFDGIDLDWEFPTSGDTAKFVKLLEKFRKALGQAPLTIAGPPDAARIAAQGGAAANAAIDWVNIMSYDYFGQWGGLKTDSNAPLYADPNDPNPNAQTLNVATTLAAYEDAGFSPGKTVMGVPFYGRSFADVPNTEDGLFQTWNGLGPDGGAPTYRQIVSNATGYQVFQQKEQRVPYAYDSAKKIWVSFDDDASIGAKAQLARTSGLLGVMIWELSGDTTDNTLINSINTNLAG